MFNVVITGVSCLEGMAATMRVRNLIDPLLEKDLIKVHNLIYEKDFTGSLPREGFQQSINYKTIGFSVSNIFSLLKFLREGFLFLKKNKSKQSKNILYNYDAPDIKNIALVLFARRLGYKIIIDIIEDHGHATKFNGFANKLRVYSSRYLLKATPFFSDSVIVISEYLAKKINGICKNKIPVTLIPVTVNLKHFINNEHTPTNGSIKILYGGSFAEKDGLSFLIKGFESVAKERKNIILVLTGMGKAGTDFEHIMNLISKSEVKDRIDYKGYLETDEYYQLLNECDIFCMTRNNSKFANAGFPFKLGEFLATGKIVIATNVGEVSKYLVNDVNALLIEPNSTEGIANALNYAIDKPMIKNDMGKRAKETAVKYFDSQKWSDELYSVLDRTN